MCHRAHIHAMNFSIKRLRRLRKESGLSQQELADLLRIGRRTLIRWEKGESTPTALGLKAWREWAGTIGAQSDPAPSNASATSGDRT
jgi:transcriptional regulator with XRE-family HTH domain